MPKDFKKRGRGRRGEEKEKRQNLLDVLQAEAEQNEQRPPKRQRVSLPPDDNDDELVLDQPEESTWEDNRDASRTYEVLDASEDQAVHDHAPETQFFGLLDESEQAFLKRIDLILANSSFESAEEKPLFLQNAWNEVTGKELKIACSQSCSRVLERLVRASDKTQLKGAWGRMKDNFLTLVQHRFASHVVEALLIASAPAVTEELLAEEKQEVEEGPDQYEDDEARALKKSMESNYTDLVAELKDNMGFLLTNQFASHTLRVLLLALSGRPLAGAEAANILQSKKKESIHSKDDLDETVYRQRVVPDSFMEAINQMASGALAGLDTNYLRALATNPLANPMLQLFLEAEFAISGKKKAKDDSSLYRRLMPDDQIDEGSQSAAFIKGLLFDPVGSRLLETIVQCAPGKTFKVIYKNMFKNDISSIVKNDVAGFVIIKILERLSQEELQGALEQILPQIGLLLEKSRYSIIKCLVERCRTRGVDVDVLTESLKSTLGASSEQVLVNLLQLDPASIPVEINDRGKVRQPADHGADRRPVKWTYASILAQTMLERADSLQQLILDGLLAVDVPILTRIAKDRAATHVLQAALRPAPTDASKTLRRTLVQKLTATPEVTLDLALDRVGSHVIDALLGATAGLQFLRERVADVLDRNEMAIRESVTARAVWKNWSMNLYRWKRHEWTTRLKDQTDEALAAAVRNEGGGDAVASEGRRGRDKSKGARAPASNSSQPQAPASGGSGGIGGAQGRSGPASRHRNSRQVQGVEGSKKPKTGIEAARARFAAQQRKTKHVVRQAQKVESVSS